MWHLPTEYCIPGHSQQSGSKFPSQKLNANKGTKNTGDVITQIRQCPLDERLDSHLACLAFD